MAIRGKAQAEKELSEHFPSFINAVATANSHLDDLRKGYAPHFGAI
jgi:hypothetical protein